MLYAFSFNAAFEKTVFTVYKGTRHDYLKTTWKCVSLNNKMTVTNSTKVYKKCTQRSNIIIWRDNTKQKC